MIYIKIHYGLGNQMFQYALARRLSIEKGIPFKLDTTFFDHQILNDGALARQYQLNIFNIHEIIANPNETKKYRHPPLLTRQLNKIKENLLPVSYRNFFREKNDSFDPIVFDCGTRVYLFGYWQDERYFKPVEEIIRKDFTFKFEPDQINAEWLNTIDKVNSISVHIRRTDYITDTNHNNKAGICDINYYNEAFKLIREQITHPHFFIFSDDPEWSQKNIKTGSPDTYFISHNNINNGYEDLRLMARCKYHIIANSSFSWWGAWLSDHVNKIVIAPRVWQLENNQNKVLPNGWIRL